MYDDDPSSTVVQAAQLAQAQLQQAQQAAAANGKDMQNSVDKRPLSDHDTDDDADGGDRPTKVKQTSVRAQMTTSVSR